MDAETQSLPPLRVRATFQPSTLDVEKRTVELTWSTGAAVLRGFWDTYWEELSMDAKHVRLDRLNNGAPFLMDHNAYRVADTPGVVERGWLADGVGRALVRFVKAGVDPEADKLFNKIADGVVTNVSVGYRVYKLEEMKPGADKIPVRRAIDWQPFEVSAVAIGADDGAGFRSAKPTETNTVQIVSRGHESQKDETAMDPINGNTQTPEQARADERERINTINTLTQRHALPAEFAERLINGGVKLEAARTAILDELARRSDNDGTSQVPSGAPERYTSSGQRGNMDDFNAAAADAMVMRAGLKPAKPHPAAADLRHTSALDMARIALTRSGRSHVGISASETVKRAMSLSDFPLILAGAIGKAIRNGYETEPSSHRLWVPVETVNDLRDQLRPLLGSAPGLEKVAELAEYTFGSMTEDSTSYKVEKFGKAIALSWELLVNDNLGAFLRVKPAMGAAARRGEADACYSIFTAASGAGPTMQDNQPLFHASHNNITAPGGMNVDGLSAARLLLRRQTALGGGQLSLVPRTLLVPPELETSAEILLASATRNITSSTEGDRPEWIGRLQLVVESRLPAANGFYLIADSAQIDHIVLGLLAENENGPVIEEEQEFVRDAWRAKIRHVYTAKALDWRGMVRVPKS